MLRDEVASRPSQDNSPYAMLQLDYRNSSNASPRSSTDAGKQELGELRQQIQTLKKDKQDYQSKLEQKEEEMSMLMKEITHLKIERDMNIKEGTEVKSKLAIVSKKLNCT